MSFAVVVMAFAHPLSLLVIYKDFSLLNIDEWVCTEEDENDYVIERFELRIKGKKPLVINNPSLSKLVFVTQQYLNCSLAVTKEILKRTVLNSPEPFTIEEHIKLLEFLEKKE